MHPARAVMPPTRLHDSAWAASVVLSIVILQLCGCAGPDDQFSEGLRVMTGRGGTKQKTDTFPAITAQAKEIVDAYPAPAWHTLIRADAADVFELVPGGRLLLGEVQVGSVLARPELADLALYDLATGEPVWRAARPDLEWGRYDLLSTDDRLLLLQGSSPSGGHFIALDVDTGRVVWSRALGSRTKTAYQPTRGLIHLLEPGSDSSALEALDARTGETRWHRKIGGIPPESDVVLVPDGDHLYLLADDVRKIDAADGTTKWHQPVGDQLVHPRARPTRRGLLVWGERRMMLLDAETGDPSWGPIFAGKPLGEFSATIEVLSVPTAADRIFVSTSRSKVCSFDLRTGRRRWQHELGTEEGTSLQSPFFLTGGDLYFSTYKSILVLDADGGGVRGIVTMPLLESGLFSDLTPDIFVERGDRVLMLREGGAVYALSRRTRQLLWKQIVDWSYELSFNTTQIDRKLREVLTDQLHQIEAADASARWWTGWTAAVDNQWRGYPSGPTYGAEGSTSLGASMVLFQSVLGLSESIGRSLEIAAVQGLAERLNMELRNATKNHMRSIQQGYFIRPYDSSKGTLVMLVELDSGKRYDLVYSPINVGMRYIDMRLPAFLVDPSGRMLYTHDLGTDVADYERYVKFGYGMPYPSVLGFSLDDMAFNP